MGSTKRVGAYRFRMIDSRSGADAGCKSRSTWDESLPREVDQVAQPQLWGGGMIG